MNCQTLLNVTFMWSLLIFQIVLYDFTNKEHDMIMRCFRIGSCKLPYYLRNFIDQSIRELPFKLAPNQVLKM